MVIPADAAATLRQLQVLDSDAERLVFSAEASAEGVVLLGDDDDLDELMGYVAAEATTSLTGGANGASTTPSKF